MPDDPAEAPSPGDRGRSRRAADYPPHVPAATGTLGMWLFLISLFMLFAAAMVGYAIIRLAGHQSPPSGAIHLPGLLWLSTALVIGVSFSMARGLRYLRIERQAGFRAWLRWSIALAIGFLVVQAPAMAMLLAGSRQSVIVLYRLIFVLVLLHALHVVGGIVALARVALQTRRGVYDHEHYLPVRHAAMYWHFLDLIWIIMFLTFLLTE